MQDLDKISINFILSTERSGSTLLSAMLNMHTEILSIVEEPFTYDLYLKYKGIKKWNVNTIESFCDDFYLFSGKYLHVQFGEKKDLIHSLTQNVQNLTALNAIKLSCLNFHPSKQKDKITSIVDKQLHFHLHLNEIVKLYPKSKFIVLVRDPRDNTYLKQKFFLNRNKKKDIYIIAKSWDFIFGKIYKTLQKIESQRTLIIKYEDLVSSPEYILKKICNFLDLEYESSMLDFHKKTSEKLNEYIDKADEKTKEDYKTSAKSITQKVNTDKVNIWKNVLTKKQSNLIWSICWKTAKKYNYEKDSSENVFYSDFLFKDFYLNFILKKHIITNLYKLLPFTFRTWIKKQKQKSHNDVKTTR